MRPFARISGPNDITTAKSAIAEKKPAGDANQRTAVARAREDMPKNIAPTMAATTSARARLVILKPGSLIDQPSSNMAITPANTIHTSV
jgi:hypothetical protein